MKEQSYRVEADIDVRVPRVPNFLLPVNEEHRKVSIADIPTVQLRAIAGLWADRLEARATEIRKEREA